LKKEQGREIGAVKRKTDPSKEIEKLERTKEAET